MSFLSLPNVVWQWLFLLYRALILHDRIRCLCSWQKIRLLDTLHSLLGIVCCSKLLIHCTTGLIYPLLRINLASLFMLHHLLWLGLELEFVLIADDGFTTVHLVRIFWSFYTHVWCVFLVSQCRVIPVWPIDGPRRLHWRRNLGRNFLLLIFYNIRNSGALLLLRFAFKVLLTKFSFDWNHVVGWSIVYWTTLKPRSRIILRRNCIFFWIIGGWKFIFWWFSIFLCDASKWLVSMLSRFEQFLFFPCVLL